MSVAKVATNVRTTRATAGVDAAEPFVESKTTLIS
jgi:hypothetical protein